MTPEQEFERANIMRLLQSFKRAFDSRSGDSLRPIWPTLSAGAAQNYQSEWQRALSQQWTYNSVHIRMAADGKRATVDTEVTVTSLMPGARENSVERRRVDVRAGTPRPALGPVQRQRPLVEPLACGRRDAPSVANAARTSTSGPRPA